MTIYDLIFIMTIPICTLAVYYCLNSFYDKQAKNKKLEIISYLIYSLGLILIFLIYPTPIIFLIYNIISFIIISFNYKCIFYKRVIYSLIIYSIFLSIESILLGVIGYFNIKAMQNSEFNSIIGLILIRVATVIIAYLIYKGTTSIKKQFKIPIYYYILHICILFGTLYLYLTSLENQNLTMSNIIIASLILILVNGIIIFIDEKIYNALVSHYEKDILKQQNIAYENQIELINQSLLTIKNIKHDMKNHILAISLMYKRDKKEDMEEYIQQVLEKIENNQNYINTSNFIIDSIVNFKLQEIENKGINIDLNINIPYDIEILAYDLTVILGNLIDNAITALKETKGERIFSLNIQCSKGSLIIFVENSFNGKINIENGIFKTTKHFRAEHGFGIENVKKSLENYGGEIDIDYTKNMFLVSVIIPYLK